jgi:hypothetical protein
MNTKRERGPSNTELDTEAARSPTIRCPVAATKSDGLKKVKRCLNLSKLSDSFVPQLDFAFNVLAINEK